MTAFFTPDGRVIAAGEDGYYRAFAFRDFNALVELVRGRKVRDWKEEERKMKFRYGRDKKQMSALFPDTHPKMEALQIELWRAVSPTRKM